MLKFCVPSNLNVLSHYKHRNYYQLILFRVCCKCKYNYLTLQILKIKIMEEQLISFETAKLAKEKGFNERTLAFYFTNSGQICNDRLGKLGSYDCHSKNPMFCGVDEVTSAPTQSLLQKWLREEHKLEVIIKSWIEGGKDLKYYHSVNKLGVPSKYRTLSNSYEEACELGLLEALNLINA